ncbi:response regulator [Trinickia violacea]|uniref:Response regulator n=1 Tax=Trinickia violacea TaxID=2571746 RepID=A0A4P8IUF3_9BURK|nr:response regulator [Trinickia violacea]QCP52898.1 response regulator [Trinickia violacea]
MSGPTLTVVLIDDDKTIRRLIHTALHANGMTVVEAQTGQQGLALAGAKRADLVIVDLTLPDMDGIDVIRDLRSGSTVPVIVLSARSAEQDKVAALDAGADDYLTKPFGLSELTARIRARVRRGAGGSGGGWRATHFGAVTVDPSARKVLRGSETVHLSPIEYRLLAALVRHAGHVLTHQQLVQEAWGRPRANSYHCLRIYMSHLRKKLERDPARPEHIVTEAGVGYRLVGALADPVEPLSLRAPEG